MNKFFNNHNNIVPEALSGLLKANADAKLYMLDGLPHTKCVIRKDWDKAKVAILSGGGAGHEPAHAGYVGQGMLTGAISGEIFASPSVDAVLAAILEVTGDAGCLLIVKNYTGDRLNFGLAAERAKNLGLKVEMIVVKDDISIPDNKQPRGIAGTLFAHKVAGYLSEQGKDLHSIKQELDNAIASIYSIGLAYSTCTVPGQEPSTETNAELGLGIHGEAGAETFTPISAKESMKMIVDRLEPKLQSSDDPVAVLLNNLGSTSNLEMMVLMNELLSSPLADKIKLVIGPQAYMTALDMHGFSVSVMRLNRTLEAALLAETTVKAWPQVGQLGQIELKPLPEAVKHQSFPASTDVINEKILSSICELLIDKEDYLNELDSKVGDGDTGLTFANGARAVLSEHNQHGLPLANPDELFLTVGRQLSTAMGGSSGVLLSIFFTSAGNAYKNTQHIPEAFNQGLETVMKYGGASLGDRTMLDAAIPAIAAWQQGESLSSIKQAAIDGAESTAAMLKANAGRSSYLRSDSLEGVKDPGAVAMALIFEKVAEVLA